VDSDSSNSGPSNGARDGYLRPTVQEQAKLVITGPFGVGKTTMVGTLSEYAPVRTEEPMTRDSIGVDSIEGLPEKTTTTVALDFGRRTLSDELVLFLFGTPGQERFLHLWEDLARGAVGALVLVDIRHPARLQEAFEVMGLLDERELPYAVAINVFADTPSYPDDQLRGKFDLLPQTPLVWLDARDYTASLDALIAVVRHSLTIATDDREELA
jgi:uncharacterized protein